MTLTGSKKARWKALYQAAMLELDNGALPARIEAAKTAIHGRMAEVDGSQVPCTRYCALLQLWNPGLRITFGQLRNWSDCSSFGRGHLDHHMNVGTPGEPEHVSLGRRRFHIALCTSNRKLTDRVSTCDRYDDAFVSSRLIALFHSIQRNSFAGDRAIQICDSANGFPCKPASTPLIT
jgi:hypothetical protein